MKPCKLFIATVLVAQLLALTPTYAGGEGNVGGGTDLLPYDNGAAWFTGRQNVVKYCVVADPSFGASVEIAESKFVEAYSLWEKYLWNILSEFHNLTTKLERRQQCDGTENLKLYFGAMSEEVAREKARYFNPIGLAIRTEFNEKTGWGKGFIWIATGSSINVDWTFRNNLLGILLHEIGHVFGCTHVDGTIMRENNGYLLRNYGYGDVNYEQALLGQIDGERQLFLQSERNFNFPGRLAFGYGKGYNRPNTTPQELDRIAKTFLKRKFVGKTSARVTGTAIPDPGSHQDMRKYQYTLHLSDEVGSADIVMSFTENPDWARRPFETRFNLKGKIFHTVGPGIGSVFSSMGMWAYGTIDMGDGKTMPVILEQNLNSILALKYIDENGIHNLFTTDQYGTP